MTIREARAFANMTQKQVEDEFGVPIRTLQNWESGIRDCPEYVHKWLVQELMQTVRHAQIRKEDDFMGQKGFSCYLMTDSGEYDLSWFYPETEDGLIPSSVITKIGRLTEGGWKVKFCY